MMSYCDVGIIFNTRKRGGENLSVCGECEMMPYCGAGIIFNTRMTGKNN